jgi:hypothetical protein
VPYRSRAEQVISLNPHLNQVVLALGVHFGVLSIEERSADGPPTDDGGAVLGDDVVEEADGEAEENQTSQMTDQLVERMQYSSAFSLVPLVERNLLTKQTCQTLRSFVPLRGGLAQTWVGL